MGLVEGARFGSFAFAIHGYCQWHRQPSHQLTLPQALFLCSFMSLSGILLREPQYRPQSAVLLIMGAVYEL